MPRIRGGMDEVVHISQVDCVVEAGYRTLWEMPSPPPSQTDRQIALHIFPHIRDGATIQLGIGGIPLWNGYISKTLLHESIVEYSTAPVFKAMEWIFLISGGLTVAYMLKLYISIFFEKNIPVSLMNVFLITKEQLFIHQYLIKK